MEIFAPSCISRRVLIGHLRFMYQLIIGCHRETEEPYSQVGRRVLDAWLSTRIENWPLSGLIFRAASVKSGEQKIDRGFAHQRILCSTGQIGTHWQTGYWRIPMFILSEF